MLKERLRYTILWSTQSGKAKACARRTARILFSHATSSDVESGYYGCSFDEYTPSAFINTKGLVIMFISTTGDGEHTDTIAKTWKYLKQKTLSNSLLKDMTFALFCLGDRVYGPNAFCAAGRKFAARIMQLSASMFCDVGYGDEGTAHGGIFSDLDKWLDGVLLPRLKMDGIITQSISTQQENYFTTHMNPPYAVKKVDGSHDVCTWDERVQSELNYFYSTLCPSTAYHYETKCGFDNSSCRINDSEHMDLLEDPRHGVPLIAFVESNERITAEGWLQDTRHLQLRVEPQFEQSSRDNLIRSTLSNGNTLISRSLASLPYSAGDIATIIPTNPSNVVDKFLSCLPESVRALEHSRLEIILLNSSSTRQTTAYTIWPRYATLRDVLTYCADICNLPEREDLRTLSAFCNPKHPDGLEHRNKLLSLSETAGSALYGDYVLKEKRNWADVLFDFDSIGYEEDDKITETGGNFLKLTVEHLMRILSPIMPRHFSIASSPSEAVSKSKDSSFFVDVCVAVVRGITRYGRSYSGLCSSYLSELRLLDEVHLWIRPGSFKKLPLELDEKFQYKTSIVCVGAGTGVAPLRGLIREREALRKKSMNRLGLNTYNVTMLINDSILVFGCRKEGSDFYYKDEWNRFQECSSFRLITAFSQDQKNKVYVQKVLREADDGTFIIQHILRGGAVYIAGAAKMARAVREEIIESLGHVVPGGEKGAKMILQKMQRDGLFAVEAWS